MQTKHTWPSLTSDHRYELKDERCPEVNREAFKTTLGALVNYWIFNIWTGDGSTEGEVQEVAPSEEEDKMWRTKTRGDEKQHQQTEMTTKPWSHH